MPRGAHECQQWDEDGGSGRDRRQGQAIRWDVRAISRGGRPLPSKRQHPVCQIVRVFTERNPNGDAGLGFRSV